MNTDIKYGLATSDIENIVSILKKNERIKQIILFGSRAKGFFKEGADIDLALKGEKLNLNDIINASLELDNLLLPYKIDLVIFERIKEQGLIDHINRIGITLFERSKSGVAQAV
jgi:predicted nucleotidyltransferase